MTNPTKFITIGADELQIAIAEDKNIVVRLMGLEGRAGLTPGIGVVLALAPGEAQKFGEALIRASKKVLI